MSSRSARTSVLLASLAVFLASAPGRAAPDPEKASVEKIEKADKAKKDEEDAAFAKRLAALKKGQANAIQITMAPDEDPAQLPASQAPSGLVMVAGARMGIYTPPLISSADVKLVIDQNMADVRTCYKKQLEDDPEWGEELILDLAIKKTGRVGEVSIAPGRVKRSVLGQCLMSAIPRWKFPEFTGETDEGIMQEVVNASFPFSFNSR